jgi:hypothetical protein
MKGQVYADSPLRAESSAEFLIREVCPSIRDWGCAPDR